MKENTTSMITLLITGISISWGAVVALVIYIRHLHLRSEKKAEMHADRIMEESEKHRKDIVEHKNEIVKITEKFTEVVTTVNTSINIVDKTLEAASKMTMKAFDDLHRTVMLYQGTK